MKNIIRLIRLASVYKWWMLLAAFLGFLTVGSGIGLLMTSAYVISKAALHPSVAELQVGIVGVRFFGISRGIFRYLERLVSHDTTFKMLTKFRVWFYKALEPLAPARLQKYKSADLLNRIVNDVQTLEHFYVRVIAPPLVAVGISLLMWILLGVYNPLFPAALFIFHLLAGVAVPVISYLYSKGIGSKIIETRAELNVLILDQIQGLNELLIFGQDEKHRQGIQDVNRKLESLQQSMARVSAMHDSLIGLLMNSAVLVMLVIAIPMVFSGLLDGVYLAVISLGIMASFEALLPLPDSMQFMEKNAHAAQRLFEMIDSEAEVTDKSGVPDPIQKYDLEIKNLTFAYEPKSKPVLTDINMQFPLGSKTAIVGPSGAGKSTLLNLLLRFWDYQQGQIILGSSDLRELSQDEVRRQMAVVSQSTWLYNNTIQENLRIANINADSAQLQDAAEKAHLHEFIMQLDDKYYTQVGDQGQQMSGGQRQRLAIARAVLKDAPILLLDEATSNLDVVTEQKMMQTILESQQNKTVIHITHRLNNLEKFDTIYVMQNGKVAQSGVHKQLAAQPGLYRQMWLIQQQDDMLQ